MELDGLPSMVTPPPAATLTFDLLTPEFNQHIYETKYICEQTCVKFPSPVIERHGSSLCLTGIDVHSDHTVHISADLSLWLVVPAMIWAPRHQRMKVTQGHCANRRGIYDFLLALNIKLTSIFNRS